MPKKYTNDPELIEDVAKDTKRIEKDYAKKQSKKRQKRIEREELGQRWVAPLLLIITLLLGFLVSLIAK